MTTFQQFEASNGNSKCQYTLTGANCQVLSVTLKKDESLHSEPGTMMLMSKGISMGASCGSCWRMCVGESLCIVNYKNKEDNGFVALTPNFPGKVVPVDLSTVGGHLVAKGGAYMAHFGKVSLSADCDCNCARCCCGGMGFARQSIKGDGTVFLAGGGTILTKTLASGERIQVDTNSIIGFQESVKMSLRSTGGCLTCCCGGEGLFNSVLEGPGLVIIESMSFEKYKNAIAPPMEPEKEVA